LELVHTADETPPSSLLVEPSNRQILGGSASTAIAIIAGQVVAGLSLLILARRLAPEDFGAYAVLYSAGLPLGGLLDFGSSQLRTRELAQGSGLGSFTSWLLRRTVWQTLAVAATIGIAQLVTGNRLGLLAAAGLISQGVTFPISLGWSGAVRALRSPALGTWLVGAGNVLLLVVVVAAPSRFLVEAAALAATASWLVTAACSWSLTRTYFGSIRSRWVGNPWAGSSAFGFFGLAIVLQGLQVVVVGAVAGSSEAGKLAAVARWVQPVYLAAAAFSTQMFPGMAAAASDATARRILRPIWVVIGVGLFVAAAIVVAAPTLVDGLLGDGYGNSATILQVLAISAIPVLFNQPMATFLQARGSERPVAIATILTVGLSLVATAIAATWVGAIAAPLASAVAQVVLLAALALLSRSRAKTPGV